MPSEPLAYNRKNAAAALDIGVDHFDTHVRPHLNPRYIGGKTLYLREDLAKFLVEWG